MKVSVIIPTLNEEHLICGLLEDIHEQIHKVDECIVIDAGSSDKTISLVKKYFPKVKIINSVPPVGGQREIAGDSSTGDLLIFFDADVRVDCNFIQVAVESFIEDRLDIACPVYEPITSSVVTKLIYRMFNTLFYCTQSILPSGAGSCILVKKETFQACGGFKKELKFDDIEFIQRASKRRKFKQLSQTVNVSDRRFREYGNVRMLFVYSILSFLFVFGRHHLANYVSYNFAHYSRAYDK